MPRPTARVTVVALVAAAVTFAGRQPAAGQVSPLAGETIGYFVADGHARFGYRASDRELAVWAIEAWAAQANGSVAFHRSAEDEALVRLYWSEPSSQLFGEMRPLTANGRRGAAVFIGTDMPALGPEIAGRAGQDPLWRDAIVYLTCVHELGHAFGLPHTRDFRDIMYFFGYGGDIVEYFARFRRQLTSRGDLRRVTPFSEADTQQFRARVARR